MLVLLHSLDLKKVGSYPQLEESLFSIADSNSDRNELLSSFIQKKHLKNKRTKVTDFLNLHSLERGEFIVSKKIIDLFGKFRGHKYLLERVNVLSSDVINEIDEEFYKIRFIEGFSIQDVDFINTDFVMYENYKYNKVLGLSFNHYDANLHKIAALSFNNDAFYGMDFCVMPILPGIFISNDFLLALKEHQVTGVDVFDCSSQSGFNFQHARIEPSLM